MASILANLYGTEKDKVNCSFFYKIGACRHGEQCSRKHLKPTFSQSILVSNIYRNPSNEPNCVLSNEQLQDHLDGFYEDWFLEFAQKYGDIEEMHICDNIGEHLVGNVYVRFREEEAAARAVADLNNRFYDGRPLWAALSPVTDFREARCRQYEQNECNRGGLCNFMHVKVPRRKLERELFEAQRKERHMRRQREREKRDRSRSPAEFGH